MSSNTGNPIQPTVSNVFCQSNEDALMIVELILQNRLHTVQRRAQDRERASAVQSGNVFVFEHTDTGIKRWTDGVHWSPSRILGNFLLYRELSRPFPPGQKKRAQRKPAAKTRRPNSELEDPHQQFHPVGMPDPGRAGPPGDSDRSLVGSLIDSYDFKTNGLIKKTISIQNDDHRQFHLISYYVPQEVLEGHLHRPTEMPIYRGIKPRGSLYISSSLRQPSSDPSRRPSFMDEGGLDPSFDPHTDEDDDASGSPSKMAPYGRHDPHHPHAFLPSSFPGGPSDYNYMPSGFFPQSGSPHGYPGDLGPHDNPMKVEEYDLSHPSHDHRHYSSYPPAYTTSMGTAPVSAPLSLPGQADTITSSSWSGSQYSGFQSPPLNTSALSGSAPYRSGYSTVGGGHYDRPMVQSPAASTYGSSSAPWYSTHSPQLNPNLGPSSIQDRGRFQQDNHFPGWATSSPQQQQPGTRTSAVTEEEMLYPGGQWRST
ncbi:hypothetical protein Dda_0900 [Drechslerella dactyloides]|uniref:Uncharacterized protein n=1 Tax=Drechslerella dactyloides TaxID=74499 RepID=A0AAD6J5C5_DREDA|nr:hypothetical protein Dda_0900 [Drechslerella dactyloides]